MGFGGIWVKELGRNGINRIWVINWGDKWDLVGFESWIWGEKWDLLGFVEKNGICWDLGRRIGEKWDLLGFGSSKWGEKWDLIGFGS